MKIIIRDTSYGATDLYIRTDATLKVRPGKSSPACLACAQGISNSRKISFPPDHGRTDSYCFGKWQLNSIFAASETAGKRMADKDTLAHMMFEQVFREKGKYTSTAGSKG